MVEMVTTVSTRRAAYLSEIPNGGKVDGIGIDRRMESGIVPIRRFIVVYRGVRIGFREGIDFPEGARNVGVDRVGNLHRRRNQ